jgi:hypothetical protein
MAQHAYMPSGFCDLGIVHCLNIHEKPSGYFYLAVTMNIDNVTPGASNCCDYTHRTFCNDMVWVIFKTDNITGIPLRIPYCHY